MGNITWDLAAIHQHEMVAGPGVVCAFASRVCSGMVARAGGFDLHHPWPKGMGGAATQIEIPLCPNHHRRQHALIRVMVEKHPVLIAHSISSRFTATELEHAQAALDQWVAAGQPAIGGWPALAAT